MGFSPCHHQNFLSVTLLLYSLTHTHTHTHTHTQRDTYNSCRSIDNNYFQKKKTPSSLVDSRHHQRWRLTLFVVSYFNYVSLRQLVIIKQHQIVVNIMVYFLLNGRFAWIENVDDILAHKTPTRDWPHPGHWRGEAG